MVLPSIFIGYLLVDWFDRISFFSLCPMYPSVRYRRLKFGRAPRIPDPATFFPFFPGSVVPLCEAALAPRPEREQATPREAAPSLCSTSCGLGGRGLSHRSRLARLLDEPWARVVASEMVVAVRAAVNAVAELERSNGECTTRRGKV